MHDWVESLIDWEQCKRQGCDNVNQLYAHELGYILGNKIIEKSSWILYLKMISKTSPQDPIGLG